jgi:hypothetical protein
MVVRGGAATSLGMVLRGRDDRALTVRVNASGDVAVATTAEQKVLDQLNPDEAFVKLGVDTMRPADGGPWPPSQRILCGLLSPSSPIRRVAAVIVAHPWFERFILVLILISSLNLALEQPAVADCAHLARDDPNSCFSLGIWLSQADVFITGFFVAEMLLKFLSVGPKA